ncbi:amidohydrolase family protein [Myxococcus faecalis]|uniref:amidohydrolase family protein n=1 Tax=Myxococcus faecalis TaxID=3115646 RepID=UPI003CED47FD
MTQGPPPRIIDAHCHIASERFIPRSFIDGVVANGVAALTAQGVRATPQKLANAYLQKLQDPLCDQLVAEMEAAGIERAVLLAADYSYALTDCPITVEETLLAHAEVLKRHPGKLVVFGGVDPRWGKDGVDLFERSLVEWGFSGFKVYPPCGMSPSAPELFPYYELCAHHRVPVVVHIGPTSPVLAFDTSTPLMLDLAARSFPTVNFILAHGSVSYPDECAMLCAYRPNVYLDVSGYQSQLRTSSDEALRRVVARGINHKVLFGTDWPVFRMQGDQRAFVDVLTAEEGPLSLITELEARLVLHDNMARLLAGAAGNASNQARVASR